MKKRIISLILCGILFMGSSNFVYASELPDIDGAETNEEVTDTADTETSGVCGDDLTWSFENQVLEISGAGAMSDYSKGNAPWYALLNDPETPVKLILDPEITSIGNYAFFDCNSLTDIELPENCISLGIDSFSSCSNLTRVDWGKSLVQIEAYAFSGCTSLSEVGKFPETLTKIEMTAFFGCSSWSGELILPSSLTTIGSYAFANCTNLTGTLTIPDSVTTIHSYAFSNCSGFTGLKLSENLTDIVSVFCNCSGLTGKIIIPDKVTRICSQSFMNCSGITEFVFGSGLTIMNDLAHADTNAYGGCTGVTKITFLTETPPEAGSSSSVTYPFSDMEHLKVIYVPKGSYEIYYEKYGDFLSESTVIREIGQEIIELNTSSATMEVGENLQLNVQSAPEDSSNKTVQWTSSDEQIATVTETGLVTATDLGEAIITCTVQDEWNSYAQCKITVTRHTKHIWGDWMTTIPSTCTKAGKKVRRCTVSSCDETEEAPLPLLEHSYEWVVVKEPAYGQSGIKQEKCTVCEALGDSISIEPLKEYQITMNTSPSTIKVGETLQLTIRFIPSEASAGKELKWKSSDTQIISVTNDGLATAQKAGTAVITCTVQGEENISAQCELTVAGHAEHIWSNWEIDVLPTRTASGKWVHRCIIDGCNSSEYSTMQPGWLKFGDKWYYLDNNGRATSGWQKVSGVWYYMNPSGIMQTGWQKVSGIWYYMNSSGAMTTGWQKVSGIWYYMNSSGAMTTGWQKVSGIWYYMNSNGAMQTGWLKTGGKWYYLNSSGAMTTGWQKINGKYYYMYSSGAMASNTRINGYYVDASGVWIPGR